MNQVFNELDLRLSVVKRWGILHTIRQQSVAEHSFNVAILADRIAVHWFGIDDPGTLYNINRYALRHDRPEALSGDIPSIVKDLFDEDELEARYMDLIPDLAQWRSAEGIKFIVKLADRIEAEIFLRMEESMGNRTVSAIRNDLNRQISEMIQNKGSNVIDGYMSMMNDLFEVRGGQQIHISDDYDRRPL